jgi:hypothetical protein
MEWTYLKNGIQQVTQTSAGMYTTKTKGISTVRGMKEIQNSMMEKRSEGQLMDREEW